MQDGTDVSNLRFLQAGNAAVAEGDLVQVDVGTGTILYQVVNAAVETEALESRNEADFVVGQAIQLGLWNATTASFERFGWVPSARTPVTRATEIPAPPPGEDEVELGCVPGTSFPVLLNSRDAISHHMAILGVTGVGKSVFVRDLIRRVATDDLRVIVVDFTREWRGRLGDMGGSTMIPEADAASLRIAIQELSDELAKFKNQQSHDYIKERKEILHNGFRAAIKDFLEGEGRIRVFELPDLSNTEGVLEYTQWFFQTLFRIARDDGSYGRRVCVVLEEAHTVVPEWNFIGLSDKSSQALVNNISQIALQGRKYNVGFIVIAQRTASVSKTVLTQCNTIIAFQCFDGTSIDFLSHYLPRSTAETLPNLRFRRAVAIGKAIRGSVPLIFDIPEIQEPAIPEQN